MRFIAIWGALALFLVVILSGAAWSIWNAYAVANANDEKTRNCVTTCQPFDSKRIDGRCFCMDIEKRWVLQEEQP